MSKDEVKSKDNDVKEVHYNYFQGQLQTLAGKVLTIVDASIPDKQQNKCVKDLIKAEFHRKIHDLQEFYWKGQKGHSVSLDQDSKLPLN